MLTQLKWSKLNQLSLTSNYSYFKERSNKSWFNTRSSKL